MRVRVVVTPDDKRRRRSKRAKRVKRRSRKVDRGEERRTAATPRSVSDRSDKPKAEYFDNTVMSDYLDVASDVENMCVEEGGGGGGGGVDIF